MHLKEIIPQPFRNIVNCFQELRKDATSPEEREKNIQKIVKDVFRMLLVLPLVSIMLAFGGLGPFFGTIAVLCFSPTYVLTISVFCSLASCISLVIAVADRSFSFLSASLGLGCFAYLCAEKYEFAAGVENFEIITPVSNQIAKVFV